jgi:PhnB protein
VQLILVPYLQVSGAGPYLEFLEAVFGAQPMAEGKAAEAHHRAVLIDDSWLEVAEAKPGLPPSRAALHTYVPDADAVYERAIKAGAKSLRAPVDQPYGDREAAIEDAAGNYWYVATHQEGETGHKPAGLRTVTPYFQPVGAPGFIQFLEQAFGAVTHESQSSPEGAVVHAKVEIGDTMVELSEAHGGSQPMPSVLHLYLSDVDDAYRRALQAGATSLSEPGDSDGERTAAVRDPFGHSWYLDMAESRG